MRRITFLKSIKLKTAIIILFALTQKSYSATWYVNDNSTSGDVYCTAVGNNSNAGNSPSLPKLTLAAAITAAANGDTIYIDKGTFTAQTHTINKQLTIIGAGTGNTIFDGNNTAINFGSITVSNVVIKNLRLTRYFLDSSSIGQVLNISGAITGVVIENVLLNGCLGGTNSLPNLNITGGANVTVKNSFFKCSGYNGSSGGGIKVTASTLSVQGTVFYQNEDSQSAAMGGALWVSGASNVTVTNCTFASNISRNGGAIGQDGGTLTVTGSCFTDNISELDNSTDGGGAIYVTGSTTTTISNCSFSNNRATNNGGNATSADGAAIKINSVTGTFSINTCSFSNNGKTTAGAIVAFDKGQDIYLDESTITGASITNCTFQTPISGEVNIQNNDLEQTDIATITFSSPVVLGGGTVLTTDGNSPTSSPATNCQSTSSIASCSVAVNCATETNAPVILSCVPNKTLNCPAVMPNYTSEVSFYDDCTATVTQSIPAGTLLTSGTYSVTMSVTDQNNNVSTCVFTLTVSGTPTPASNFGDFASAVNISTNGGTSSTFYNTTGSGSNLIGSSTFASTNLGTHSENSSSLKLTGAEIKTWKSGTGNVCGGTLYYVVYTTGSRPAIPTFSTFSIPYKANCSSGVFSDGLGPCNGSDQKWSTVAQNIDLTNRPAGNYTLEVFYLYTGSDSGGGCGTNQYITNSCNNFTATFTIGSTCTAPTISTQPSSTQYVCQNGSATNISVVAAGSATLSYQWYSNSTNSNSGGTSLGSSNGAQTNTYTPSTASTGTLYYYCIVTNSCGTATTNTSAVVVTAAPNAGTLSGTQAICSNGTTTFTSNGDSGGAWSSSNTAIATVNASTGVITPIAAGTATITYTVTGTGGCSNATATRTVTVTLAPNAGTLSGTQAICSNGTTTFTSNGDSGGAWSSSNTAIATVNASTGVITPIAAGTATITYTVTGNGGCSNATATRTVTVTLAPNAGTLSGTQAICSNGTTTFTSNGDSGGAWSSSNTAIATVNTSTGVITPIAAGTATITYTVTGTGGCSNATATRTVTVTAVAAITGQPLGASYCLNDSVSPLNVVATGTSLTYQWYSNTSNSNSGGSIISGETNSTYSPSTAIAGTSYYYCVVTDSCGNITSNVASITIVTTVAGTASSDQSICSGTQPADITLSGNTGSVIKWQKSTDLAFTSPVDIASTSTTLTGAIIGNLTSTTYFRAVVQNASCSQQNSNVITITVPSSTWNGTAWSNGVPTIATTVTFTGNYTATTDMYACSLHVTNNANVVINSGFDYTVYGSVTVDSGSTLTFNNNSNLLQQTDVANTGNIKMKRNTNPLMRLDYTLWGSPVTGQNLLAFSPLTLTNRFYTYNTSTNLYNAVNPSSTSFMPGDGYQIRTPNNHPLTPTIWTGTFEGVPNNGPYTKTITNISSTQRFNMVGNPYPSPIDMYSFTSVNSANITGTIWFWRKTNSTVTESIWSTWNSGTFVAANEPYVSDPNDLIRNGQGFFIKASDTGTSVTFNNSMRVSDNSNQFFRNSNVNNNVNTIEKHRIWLNVFDSNNDFFQQAVTYIQGGTTVLDQFDGENSSSTSMMFTSSIPNNSDTFVIQSRPLPFDVNDSVPLNFVTNSAGTYSIAIDHKDGIFSSNVQNIFILDKYLQTFNNINNGPYSFSSNAGNFTDRFELRFVESSLSSDEYNFNNSIIVYGQNDEIVINSGKEALKDVKIFDIRGRLIAEKKNVNSNETSLKIFVEKEVLLLQIVTESGKIINKKIII